MPPEDIVRQPIDAQTYAPGWIVLAKDKINQHLQETSMGATYWEVGRQIMEFEQGGENGREFLRHCMEYLALKNEQHRRSIRQAPNAAIHLAESIHRPTRITLSFIIRPSAFSIAMARLPPSAPQKTLTRKLVPK